MASSIVSPAMKRRAKLSSVAIPYREAKRFNWRLRDRALKKALEPEYMGEGDRTCAPLIASVPSRPSP